MNSTPSAAARSLALITGASSGIGRAYAERLAAAGHDLVVVARRGGRLIEVKQKLESLHGVSVQTLVADLSTEPGRQEVDAAAADPRMEIVVDCAALAHYMPFLDLPPEQAEELVKLNVLAPVRLIRAALPSMVERKRRTIISPRHPAGVQQHRGQPATPPTCGVRGHQGLPIHLHPAARPGTT